MYVKIAGCWKEGIDKKQHKKVFKCHLSETLAPLLMPFISPNDYRVFIEVNGRDRFICVANYNLNCLGEIEEK